MLLNAMRSSENTLSGIAKSLIPYYTEDIPYDNKAIEKFLSDNHEILEDLEDLFNDLDDWNENSLDTVLKKYQKDNDLPVPKVNQPIRIALTRSTKSPSLGLTLEIFGKKSSLDRINSLKKKLAS